MAKELNIGLFGFGCVGQGLYHVLNNSTGFKANIKKIAVKDRSKKRNVSSDLITFDKWEILNDPSINVIVELIDDAEEAFRIVSTALKNGKHVVTANKKLLAVHLEELYRLQKENNVSLLYEGAVCGSIPIIRSLEEYFDNEELEKVSGVFNGTTNYILTKTISEKLSYETALQQAQEKGFAETDPTSDVEGFDPKYKAAIIAFHAFGVIIPPDEILNVGITALHESDINYASEKNYKIKLTPVVQRVGKNKVSVFVLPAFVKNNKQLYHVDNEFNGVIIQGKFSGEQFLQGRGAGSYPTGAAVLSDVSALSYGYRYEFKKYVQKQPAEFTTNAELEIYLRYNSVIDLEKIEFNSVSEKYTGSDYNYIIGKIHLSQLIENRNYILANKLFVSLVNDTVAYSEETIQYKQQFINA